MRAHKTGMFVASVVIVGFLSLKWGSEPSKTHLQCNVTQQDNTTTLSNPACLSVESNRSWLAWLKGDSRSAQFHYLDLLELLTNPIR